MAIQWPAVYDEALSLFVEYWRVRGGCDGGHTS